MNAATPQRPINETTERAKQDTMLSPRFYTTDFAAMDRMDIGPVRAEWDELMAEFARDTNKGHFIRNSDFDIDLSQMPEDLRGRIHRFSGQFGHVGILRLRAVRRDQEAGEEPGHARLVRLHEPRRGSPCRLHQRHSQGFRRRCGSRFPDQGEEVHVLQAEIHILCRLSVGKDRLCSLHHDLSGSWSGIRTSGSIRSLNGSRNGATTSFAMARHSRW